MKDFFQEWLKSKDGQPANDSTTFHGQQPYLQNRLRYAFFAGMQVGENGHRLQATLEWYEERLKKKDIEIRSMKKLLKQYSDNQPSPL